MKDRVCMHLAGFSLNKFFNFIWVIKRVYVFYTYKITWVLKPVSRVLVKKRGCFKHSIFT